ncbi:retrovirus-related pol polyprotein from transposon TNT 1-94 [Tanacetum coccineum]
MGPPPTATPGSEKSVSFQKSILGPRPKHIIVNNVKVPVASDNEVKQFYKPLSKPGVGFLKRNFRSKTPPPRRLINNYPRPKTPQPKRNISRQNQPRGFPVTLNNFQRQSYMQWEMCLPFPYPNHSNQMQDFSITTLDAMRYWDKCLRFVYINRYVLSPLGTRDSITDSGCAQTHTRQPEALLKPTSIATRESLNVTFDETPPPLVDDDLDEEEAIWVTEKKNLENDIEDETLEIDEIVNIKESKNYPLENVIGNLNQRTLRSQAQNQIARLESIRILLAYACALDLKLFQIDVKSAFRNGFINEEVYVAQPSGFIDFKKPDHVNKLKKALYGLKQAPKACQSSRNHHATYTSVYTDSEPGRVFWGADEEIPDGGVPRVIVYGYDRLPMQPVDPPSPDYVPGPEHPSSPDYAKRPTSCLSKEYPQMNRTSNLLPAITESILRFLLIEEAVRTSILSREWRAELTDVSESSDGAESSDGERMFDQPSKKKKLKQLT